MRTARPVSPSGASRSHTVRSRTGRAVERRELGGRALDAALPEALGLVGPTSARGRSSGPAQRPVVGAGGVSGGGRPASEEHAKSPPGATTAAPSLPGVGRRDISGSGSMAVSGSCPPCDRGIGERLSYGTAGDPVQWRSRARHATAVPEHGSEVTAVPPACVTPTQRSTNAGWWSADSPHPTNVTEALGPRPGKGPSPPGRSVGQDQAQPTVRPAKPGNRP